MNREDTIKLARESGWDDHHAEFDTRLQRFADLVISHKLDEIADKLQQDFKGAFGADTCASWASWIRNQK